MRGVGLVIVFGGLILWAPGHAQKFKMQLVEAADGSVSHVQNPDLAKNESAAIEMEEFTHNYPFSFLNYDPEARPVWISEFGRFDMEAVVAGGPKKMRRFEDYLRDVSRLVKISLLVKSAENRDGVFILDFAQFLIYPQVNVEKLSFVLQLLREHAKDIEEHVAKIYVVNANFSAESLISLVSSTVFRRDFRHRVVILGKGNYQELPLWLQEALANRLGL